MEFSDENILKAVVTWSIEENSGVVVKKTVEKNKVERAAAIEGGKNEQYCHRTLFSFPARIKIRFGGGGLINTEVTYECLIVLAGKTDAIRKRGSRAATANNSTRPARPRQRVAPLASKTRTHTHVHIPSAGKETASTAHR